MAVVSGQFGTIHIGASELLEVSGWTLNKRAAIHQYSTNTTNGYKKTVAGIKSGSGRLTGYLDSADLADQYIEVGIGATAKLYIDASQFYTVPLMIESFDVTVDIEDGEPLSFESGFVTNGAWTNP